MTPFFLPSLIVASLLIGAGFAAQAADAPSRPQRLAQAGSPSHGGSTGGAGAARALPLSQADRGFINKAAGSGMFEVEVSRMADQKTSDIAVKNYAAMLVKHHGEANAELLQLITSKGLEPPQTLPADLQATMGRLSRLSGTEFDREYMSKVGIDAHQADIKQFETASRSVKDPELKTWIDKTLPTLRHHLTVAQQTPRPGMGPAEAAGASGAGAGSGAAGGPAGLAK